MVKPARVAWCQGCRDFIGIEVWTPLISLIVLAVRFDELEG